jgi:YgiT-type zinc finger domain-containing protein
MREDMMRRIKCTSCRQADVAPGTTTITLERDQSIFVIRHVPAQVCPNCGEAYMDEQTTAALFSEAEAAMRHGSQVNIREHASA